MSDPDYRFDRQGGEAPLRMDAHQQRRSRGPAPVTLIVSLLLLLGVGGGVLYMYRSGVKSGDAASRSLGKPLGDVRAPAPASAAPDDATSGLSISRDDASANASVPTLAPAPQEPLPPQAGASTVPAAPPPAASSSQVSQGAVPVVSPPPPNAAASLPPPPPPPRDAAAPPRRAAARPDAKPQSIDQLLARSDGASADRAAVSRSARDKPAAAPKDAGGPVVIQIGAFSSERLADQEWSKAAALAPGAMAGKGKRVVPVSKDGDTLYRTSITGFSSRDQALALCDRLRASGGHCFVH